MSNNSCPICLEEYYYPNLRSVALYECGHKCCRVCALRLLKDKAIKCFMCRGPSEKNIDVFQKEEARLQRQKEHLQNTRTQLKNLLDCHNMNKYRKILILYGKKDRDYNFTGRQVFIIVKDYLWVLHSFNKFIGGDDEFVCRKIYVENDDDDGQIRRNARISHYSYFLYTKFCDNKMRFSCLDVVKIIDQVTNNIDPTIICAILRSFFGSLIHNETTNNKSQVLYNFDQIIDQI